MEPNLEQSHIESFKSLEILANQIVEGFITGLHKSPFHGFSVEFSEHRIYNTGESTKNIDWKLFARTDKLFSKRFEEETNLRCQLVVDNSSSMYFPVIEKPSFNNLNKITFSAYAAAVLASLLKRQRDAFSLCTFSDTIEFLTETKSNTAHQKYIYSLLEQLLNPALSYQKKPTNVAQILHTIAETTHKRSMIVIFSDMLENTSDFQEIFQALKHLKHNKHEVILFHVVDKAKEIDFEYENRLYKFIDLENEEEIKIYPSEVKQHYVESIKHLFQDLKTKCRQYQIDIVEVDINQGFRQILVPYLLKRKKYF